MMSAIRHMHRVIAVLMIALWGAVGIVAPAHAAEEDIHHAMQHDASEERTVTQSDPVDEGAVHPEHAAHCTSGMCHCHVVARGLSELRTLQHEADEMLALRKDIVPQTSQSSLFRPPRI